MTERAYVHGYTPREVVRLDDQASTLAELLHHDSVFPPGARVLEAGCGTGAQTAILAAANPEVLFTSIDRTESFLEQARDRIARTGCTNVGFEQADIFDLPFPDASFDHVFVCFVLEHLPEPADALIKLQRVLKPDGSLVVIEGDHGSWYCHPESREARLTVQCLIDLQARCGGDSLIGRRLFPLLVSAGLRDVWVSPRMVYVDSSRPGMVDGFSKKTFIAMVEEVRDQALALGLIDEPTWNKGIRDMYRATAGDGTFCYTFFKGAGLKDSDASG